MNKIVGGKKTFEGEMCKESDPNSDSFVINEIFMFNFSLMQYIKHLPFHYRE